MKPAAFSGDYVDMKFIKTRCVAQLHIEIPLEQAAAFIAAFGAPNPAEGVPVAIARLIAPAANVAPAQIEKTRQRWPDMPLAQQAAIRCGEEDFRRFLCKHHNPLLSADDPDDTANSVREWCGVKSRTELNSNVRAAAKWKQLDDAFWFWSRGIEQ